MSITTQPSSAGDQEIAPQHYAFLVSETEFDATYG
jgi:hypothetical protein